MAESFKQNSRTVYPKPDLTGTDSNFSTNPKEDPHRRSFKQNPSSKTYSKDQSLKAKYPSNIPITSSEKDTSIDFNEISSKPLTFLPTKTEPFLISCNNNALGGLKSPRMQTKDVSTPIVRTPDEIEEGAVSPPAQLYDVISRMQTDNVLAKLKQSRAKRRSNMTLLSPTPSEIKAATESAGLVEVDLPVLKTASKPFYSSSPPIKVNLTDMIAPMKEIKLEEMGFDPRQLARTDPTVAKMVVDTLRFYTEETDAVLQNIVLILEDNLFSNKEAISKIKKATSQRNVKNDVVYNAMECLISQTKDPTSIPYQMTLNSTDEEEIDPTFQRAIKAKSFLEQSLRQYMPSRRSRGSISSVMRDIDGIPLMDKPSTLRHHSVRRNTFVKAAMLVPKVSEKNLPPRTNDRDSFDFALQSGWFFENVETDDTSISNASKTMLPFMAAAWHEKLPVIPGTPSEEAEVTISKKDRHTKGSKKARKQSSLSRIDRRKSSHVEKTVQSPLTQADETSISSEEPPEEPDEEPKSDESSSTPEDEPLFIRSLVSQISEIDEFEFLRNKSRASSRDKSLITSRDESQTSLSKECRENWQTESMEYPRDDFQTTVKDEPSAPITPDSLASLEKSTQKQGQQTPVTDESLTPKAATLKKVTPKSSKGLKLPEAAEVSEKKKKLKLPKVSPKGDLAARYATMLSERKLSATKGISSRKKEITHEQHEAPPRLSTGDEFQLPSLQRLSVLNDQRHPVRVTVSEEDFLTQRPSGLYRDASRIIMLPSGHQLEPTTVTKQPESVGAYLARHGILELFEDLITSLVLTRPRNPLDSLIDQVRTFHMMRRRGNVL